MTVMVSVVLVAIEERKLAFEVDAHDGADVIARGTHERLVILREKFDTKVAAKLAASNNDLA